MTVAEALGAIRTVGTVENSGGKLKLRFPESLRAELQPAIDRLRIDKAEGLTRLAEMERAESALACAVLNRAGVRIMALTGGATIGVWSDLDGPEVRAALRTLHMDTMPVMALESRGIPIRYKVRNVPDHARAMSWEEWKAAALNRLFLERGAAAKPGRITAATVQHGERKAGCDE